MNFVRVFWLIVCCTNFWSAAHAVGVDDIKQKFNRTTPEQIRELADMFAGGVGVPADSELALALYRDAADGGDAEAAFSAGFRLIYSNDKSELSEQALAYLKQAASQKHPAATLWLGIISEQLSDVDQALYFYQQAAAFRAPSAYDRWSTLLLNQPVTKQNLATLYAFVTQDIPLSDETKSLVLEKDYLLILGQEDARFMQQQLTGIGFDTKGVDGLIGPNSKQALSAFQKAKGRSKSNNGILTILDLRDLGFF